MSFLTQLTDRISRRLRIFFFKNDVLRSSHLRGDDSTIQNIYAIFAPVYDWIFPHIGSFQDTIDRMNDVYINDGDRVLDLGAGTGIVSLKTAVKASLVVAFDLQEKMLVQARKKAIRQGLIQKIDICQGSATELPFKVESFHSVISSFMEVYLDIPNKRRMLDEVHRILYDKGRVTFITGVGELSGRYILKDVWEEILAGAGFGDIQFEDRHDVLRLVSAVKIAAGSSGDPGDPGDSGDPGDPGDPGDSGIPQ